MKNLRTSHEMDYVILTTVLLLIMVGIVMVYSASAFLAERNQNDPAYFLKRHLLWVIIGIIAMIIASNYDYHKWHKNSIPLLLVCTGLLLLVLIIGPIIAGSQRWLFLLGLSFQPAELAKLVLVIFLASYFDKFKSKLKDFVKGILPVLLVIGIILGLILKEPDLGTPILLAGTAITIMFIVGVTGRYIFWVSFISSCGALLSVLLVKYRFERLAAFIINDPTTQSEKGYQANQALIAIGSGGFFGRGLGKSLLRHFYLPNPHTDYIFPILAEELGLIGGIGVIFLFAILVVRGWTIATRSKDMFGQIIALGITTNIVFQFIFNVAVATRWLPTKGLTLPLISFGGSSMLITCLSIGILLNISKTAVYKNKSSLW